MANSSVSDYLESTHVKNDNKYLFFQYVRKTGRGRDPTVYEHVCKKYVFLTPSLRGDNVVKCNKVCLYKDPR